MCDTGKVRSPAVSARADGPYTVLFDFDGVLLRGDAFGLFVRERFRRARWRVPLAWLLCLLLLPSLPFTRRWVVWACVVAALTGISQARYRAMARAYAAELVRQPRRFHRQGLDCLRRHLAAGDTVWVVTGCEQSLVQGIFQELGLPEVAILASRLRAGGLGMRMAHHNVGEGKLVSLREAGVKPPWDMAYGDSVHDLPMLREARQAVLVNASEKWRRRAERALGREVTAVLWY